MDDVLKTLSLNNKVCEISNYDNGRIGNNVFKLRFYFSWDEKLRTPVMHNDIFMFGDVILFDNFYLHKVAAF